MVLLLKVFAWIIARLPLPVALAIGRGIGRLFGAAASRQRTRAIDQLHACFPEKSHDEVLDITRAMFANLGMNTIDMLRWLGGNDEELKRRVVAVNDHYLQQVAAKGKGIAVLTAHIGNFDVMALWAASRHPLTILSKEIKNRGVNEYWMKKRSAAGLHILPAHKSYRACLAVLKRNEVLGFILDQNMTRDEGIFVNFFGKPACTTPGLAMLAGHAGAEVLPVFAFRKPDGNHEIRFWPPIPPPADRKPESLAAATQAYSDVMEEAIRLDPAQWIWMHRRWRTQPLPAEGKEIPS